MICYKKFKLKPVLRSHSAQKKTIDEEAFCPQIQLVKKRQSQCRESSNGDQSTIGNTETFQDTPKDHGTIDRFYTPTIQQGHKISKSLVLNQNINGREGNKTPVPNTKTVPLYAQQLDEFNKSYQILNSDSPAKKYRTLISSLQNYGSSQELEQSETNKNKQIKENNQSLNSSFNNHSLNQNATYSSTFEEHCQQLNKQSQIQRKMRIQSLSNSPKKRQNQTNLVPISLTKIDNSPQKSSEQLKEEEEEQRKQELQILKFDNLVKHRLQKQMIELNKQEAEEYYNNTNIKDGQEIKCSTKIPYSLYLMKKDRDLLIERIKEIHKQPQDKQTFVKENIIKEVRIKNLQNHQLLEKIQLEEGEKHKQDLLSKNSYKSTVYDVLALNQKSKSRVKSRLEEELPAISRFNSYV